MPTTTLPRGNTRNFERVLVGGEPQTVALDELQVDESYQRNRLNYHIRQMCDNFMELAIAAPVVGRRSDNSLWVIDGQQRLEAARREGYDAALVLIVDSTGPEFEAAIFRWLNNRRGISAAIIFRCNVKANDPDTLCIKDIVERTGFRFQGISPVNGGLTIGCIGEIVRTYHERGADQLELLLQIAHDCWPNDASSVESVFVAGMARFLAAAAETPQFDHNRMLDRFSRQRPAAIQATVNVPRGGNVRKGVAQAIAAVYNGTTRLPSRRVEI